MTSDLMFVLKRDRLGITKNYMLVNKGLKVDWAKTDWNLTSVAYLKDIKC